MGVGGGQEGAGAPCEQRRIVRRTCTSRSAASWSSTPDVADRLSSLEMDSNTAASQNRMFCHTRCRCTLEYKYMRPTTLQRSTSTRTRTPTRTGASEMQPDLGSACRRGTNTQRTKQNRQGHVLKGDVMAGGGGGPNHAARQLAARLHDDALTDSTTHLCQCP